jgi:glycosyltransferase involved in cell wall biosynthesis
MTASLRAEAYARYLKSFGYYPVIVTRNWDVPIHNQNDLAKPSGVVVQVIQHEDYEVHYLPFEPGLRDRLLSKHGASRFVFFRRILTLKELLCQNFSIKGPYRNLYHYSKSFIEQNDDIKKLIVIANPYALFQFGFRLKKKFPVLKWIADYRDDWTTNQLTRPRHFMGRILRPLERKSERQWVNMASFAVTVSDVLQNRLNSLLSIPIHVIRNGFFDEDYDTLDKKKDAGTFLISYSGAIYPQQDFEPFAKMINKLNYLFKDRIKIKVRFIGAEYEEEGLGRIRELFDDELETTGRLSNKKCLALESEADVLFMTRYGDLKGIPTSKLYQYIGHRKPVLLVPSDHDVIADILEETGLGLICEDEKDAFEDIKKLIDLKLSGKLKDFPFNKEAVTQYSRRAQVEKMAGLMDGM